MHLAKKFRNPPARRPGRVARSWACAGLLLALVAGPGVMRCHAAEIEPRWSSIELKLRSLVVPAQATLHFVPHPAGEAAVLLRAAPGQPLAPAAGSGLLEVGLDAVLWGKQTRTVALLDSSSLQLMQLEKLSLGRIGKYRVSRFVGGGVLRWRHQQEGRGREDDPSAWPLVNREWRAEPALGQGESILDPLALPLVAAGMAGAPLSVEERLVYADGGLFEVRLEAAGTRLAQLGYEVVEADGSLRRAEHCSCTRVRLRVVAREGYPEAEFNLLGLRDDIEILVDPQTGAPLEWSGGVPGFGLMTIQATRLTLR